MSMNSQTIPALHVRLQTVENSSTENTSAIHELRTAQAVQGERQAVQGADLAQVKTDVRWLRDRWFIMLTASGLLSTALQMLVQYWLGKH